MVLVDCFAFLLSGLSLHQGNTKSCSNPEPGTKWASCPSWNRNIHAAIPHPRIWRPRFTSPAYVQSCGTFILRYLRYTCICRVEFYLLFSLVHQSGLDKGVKLQYLKTKKLLHQGNSKYGCVQCGPQICGIRHFHLSHIIHRVILSSYCIPGSQESSVPILRLRSFRDK